MAAKYWILKLIKTPHLFKKSTLKFIPLGAAGCVSPSEIWDYKGEVGLLKTIDF